MLYKYQKANGYSADQCNQFIPLFIEAKEKKKLGSRVPRVKQILGNEALAIKGIAQRVGQRNEIWRRIEWNQRNGDKPGAQKNAEGAKEQNGQVRITNGFHQHPKTGAPEDRKDSGRDILCREVRQYKIV